MSANFGIFEINFINIIIYHYYYYYLNQILTILVALKSSLLTLRPGGSPQDQVRKNQKRTRPISSHLDQTRLDNWPKRTVFLVQLRQPWKSRLVNGPILPTG